MRLLYKLRMKSTSLYKWFWQIITMASIKEEISDREKLGYPPFTRIALIEVKDESEKRAEGAINDFYNELIKYKKWLNISSPAYAVISKLKGFYRFHILIKSKKETDPGGSILRKVILDAFVEFNKRSRYKEARPIYDIDPQSVM